MLAVAFCATAVPARADFPYAAGDPSDFSTWHLPGGANQQPNDLGGKTEWMYASTQEPNNHPVNEDPRELLGYRGAYLVDQADVDQAWRSTAGRPDVTVSVLDSGIKWNDFSAMWDLRKKTRLSKGELEQPNVNRSQALEHGVDCSTYTAGDWDANGDGVFNVLDYECDDRVSAAPAGGDGPTYPYDWPLDAALRDQPLLDPQDVLIAFSDGMDDDSNGFKDDIVGWDFLDNDNDPYDDVQYGHGTGEARDSNAEANNYVEWSRPTQNDPNHKESVGGDLGACPNCTVIYLRVGDSFVADVNRFAQATIYATDNDVSVVQEALGTLNMSKLGRDAVEYAYDHGVTVIASAADEAAEHHNWPSTYPHVIVVNSVTQYDDTFTPVPRSYLQFNGCTNFSSKITIAIPSVSCSSDATGRSSGMAGLVYSEALNAYENNDIDTHPTCERTDGDACVITPNEVRQLMASGVVNGDQMADDVNFAEQPEPSCSPAPLPGCTDPNNNSPTTRTVFSPLATTKTYPARRGHDMFYGYGRVNMNRTVDTLAAGKLPPEVEITGPDWYDQVDPAQDTFDLKGTVFARGDDYTCRVLVAPGSKPNNAEDTASPPGDFKQVDSTWCDGSTARSAQFDGVLAKVGIADLESRFPPNAQGFDGREQGVGTPQSSNGRPDNNAYGFTVKVVATRVDDDSEGEDRRNMFLHRDQDMLEGFPRKLQGDIESSPLLVDLDGDNRNELVLASSDGTVHAFHRDGSELPGWPVRTDPLPLHTGGHAFTSGEVSEDASHGAVLGSAAAADMDRDGVPEVVVGDFEGKVYAFAADGTRLFRVGSNPDYSGRPLQPFVEERHGVLNRTQHGFMASPVLADIDGDDGGRLEIVAAGMDRHLYAWNDDGSSVPGFPLLVVDMDKAASVDPQSHRVDFKPDVGAVFNQGAIVDTPAVGDLTGDGKPEIAVGTNEEYDIDQDGGFNAGAFNTASLALLEQTGVLKYANTRLFTVDPRAGSILKTFKLGIINAELLPVVGEGVTGAPVIANVDCPQGDDGNAEVGAAGNAGPAYIFRPTGQSCYGQDGGKDRALATDFATGAGKTDTPAIPAVGHPAFGDMGDGLSFFAPAAGVLRALDLAVNEYQTGGQDFIGAWNTQTSQFRPNYPQQMNDLQFLTGPSIADVDGLPGEEVVAASASMDLQAYNAAGAPPSTAWPKLTGDWVVANPLIGSWGTLDTDADATKVVGAFTRSGLMLAYSTGAPACSPSSSPRFHHDNANSGEFSRDATSPGRPMDAAVASGKLTWKAPGDDLLCGKADHYEVATSDSEIGPSSFAGADAVTGAPDPADPGSPRDFALPAGVKRYVALRAVDDQGNVGRPAVVDRGAGSPAGPPPPPPPGDVGAPLDDSKAGRCLPSSQRVTPRGIGRLRLGATRRQALRALGNPRSRKPGTYRWCVRGGGSVLAFFDKGRARLVATTARGHRARGVGPRSSLTRLRSRYPRARAARGFYVSRRLAFQVRAARVRVVAVGDRRIVSDPARLRATLGRGGL